jgi:thioesterase domain-containing protein/SAM-dependent methyltransferase
MLMVEVVLDEKPPAPEPIQEPKIVVKPPMKMFNPGDYESKAVLVQGRPRLGGPILFLVTDGGGLAAVYVQLPPLAPGLAVYALDSPFMGGRESEYFAPGVNIEGIASIYARAVRKVQPHGPYMLGGYSIGGVYAYELTRYLINTGDRVHSFLCLDAACPRSLRGIIDVDVEVCQMMGMFDSISEEDQRKPLTEAQKIHVAGCVRTAGNFDPVPVKPEDRPEHIYCIWARTGFVDHLSDKIIEVGHAIAQREGIAQELNPEWLEWLGSEKVSFGPRGWERLLGDNIETFVIEGDHFSIMMRPRVKVEMGPLCQKLMKRILSALDKTHTASSLVSQGVKSTVSGANSKIKEAYRAALALAPKYAEEAGCLDFLTRVYPGQKRLVLAYIVEAFAKLGCSLKDMPQGTALEPAGVLPKFGQLLDALREILEDGRLLEWRNGKRIRTYRPIEQTSSQTLYEALIKQNQPHAATHQLLHVTGSRLAECLTGAEDPMHIMFAQNRRLLQEFYTQAPMLVVASRLVTEVLRRVFTGSTEVIRILEVGAGLGGTTKYILDMLTEAGIPFKFTYTDVSPSLTGSAKQRYKHLPRGSIEYMTLDIEQPAPPELLGRFHAVISTNCIHATKSLTASCANARKMLRPGGFLAVVEVMPRLFWLDLVFGLLEGWWLFEDGRRHCLASESFWISSLEAAGYSNVVYAEEGDGYKPNPQVIVACTD